MVLSSDSSPPPHVALFAFPFGTHVAPLYALARALATAAPAAIFSFVSLAKTLESLPRTSGNLHLLAFEEEMPDGGSAGFVEVVDRFLDSAPGKILSAAKAASQNAGGVPVSCVVSDAFVWMADFVAEEMGVPWVTVFPGFPLALLAHVYTDDLRSRFESEDKVLSTHANTHLDFIPGLATMRVRDLPEGIIFGDSNSKFSLNLHSMVHRLPRAAAIVLSTLAGLEPDSTFSNALNRTLPIGPLNFLSPPPPTPDKENCLPWLDSHELSSVVYIAFGTISFLPPTELAELAHGLEDSGVPFLWSLKEEMRSSLPEGFVERTRSRGKMVNWAPQVSVLSHAAIGVFVTHNGWNSTLESIMAGEVMLCRPIFADQRMIARAVESILGTGTTLDSGITREAFVGAVDAVLRGDDGKRMRKRVAEIRERTEKAVLPGGSSSESFKSLVALVCRN
uniref:Anthocyanidin 3-O-glucosyltransferase n=1 Tax=Cymbidium hybrid cultivar TaxID=28471 RepID=A0A5A4PVQ5_9ASPA|nr:anthocyanidin 3-O-glucosyltransferase [Cymbidium hybrid cultivar]